MAKAITKTDKRTRRKIRSRAQISGTALRPRLAVRRSLAGMYAQLIDDTASRTIVGRGSKNVDAKIEAGERTAKIAEAYRIGFALAKAAQEKKITTIVFDRSGYPYHGRVQALADGARDGGLKF